MITQRELQAELARQVAEAGSAKKWLRKNKVLRSFDHALHMIASGDAATLSGIIDALGYKPVTMYVKDPRP